MEVSNIDLQIGKLLKCDRSLINTCWYNTSTIDVKCTVHKIFIQILHSCFNTCYTISTLIFNICQFVKDIVQFATDIDHKGVGECVNKCNGDMVHLVALWKIFSIPLCYCYSSIPITIKVTPTFSNIIYNVIIYWYCISILVLKWILCSPMIIIITCILESVFVL